MLKKKNNKKSDPVENSLADVIGAPGVGFPQNQGAPWSTQLSQPTTAFINLRWYLVSNFRQFLSEAYVELGLVQTIVDVPVDDALRGGIEVKSKQLNEEQIAQLLISVDREDDLATVAQSAKWNRLFGGAGILILVADQDPTTPLDWKAITKDTNVKFRAADMWELLSDLQNSDGYDPTTQTSNSEFYSYYSEKIHKSRVMQLRGITAPSFIRPRLRGWGFSVVETLVRSINQYLKATDLAFEVLDEFKVDIYKIKNLVNSLLSPQGSQKIKERIQTANYQKNYQNAVVMDSEDDWDHKQLSFTGMSDVMKEIRMQVASDMRMPLTKLFGISAAGFNSGEDDIEVYNAMVEGQVRNKIKYPILRMLEVKCQQMFGFVPDDLSVTFKPLRVLSGEQEENVKTQKFTRLSQAQAAGLVSVEEFRDAANKGNLFDVILDTSDVALDELDGYEDDTGVAGKDEPALTLGDPTRQSPAAEAKEAKEVKEPKDKEAPTPSVKNTLDFDLASYELDDGDDWIDARRISFFDKDKAKDKSLWSKAEATAHEAGKDWRFATWLYLKHGGQF